MAPSFKDELREWRAKRYQKEAAAVLGVNLRTYQSWEYGERIPKSFVMIEIRSRMQTNKDTTK